MGYSRPIFTLVQQVTTALPDVILALDAINPAATSFDLVWAQPELNGLTFSNYVVQVREAGGTFVDVGTPTATPTGASPFQVTGLTPETEYEARVKVETTEASGQYGVTASIETTPDLAIFNNDFAFFVVSNITTVYIVALDASDISRNGAQIASLAAGEVYTGPGAQFDEFIGTGAFTIMGLIANHWFTINPSYTVGKSFAYGPIRNNPQTVSVYAFQDANVTVTVGGNVVASGLVTAGTGQNFTYSIVNQNCLVEADGLIMAAQTSNGSVDQTCLLPASRKVIGFPSNSARVYPTQPMTFWGAFRANGLPFGGGGQETTAQVGSIDGTGSQYSGDAVLVSANKPITAASFADSDGGKAAPFLPTALMKQKFGVPFIVERVNFAGTEPFTVTTNNGGSYNSTGSGAVQYLHITAAADRAAGTVYTSSAPVGGWSEPDIQDQDEYIMFGH